MTNMIQPLPLPLIAPQPPPLVSVEEAFSYYMSLLYEADDQRGATDTLDDIGEDGADNWWEGFQTMIKGSGIHDPPEKDFLAYWLNKPATWADAVLRQAQVQVDNNEAMIMGGPQKPIPPLHSWESYFASFPREAEKDWLTFQRLRVKYNA